MDSRLARLRVLNRKWININENFASTTKYRNFSWQPFKFALYIKYKANFGRSFHCIFSQKWLLKFICKQSWRTCQPVGPYWILRSPSAQYLMKIRKNSYLNCITVSFIVDLSVGLATLNIFQHCSPGVTDFVWRSLKLIIIIVIEHNLNSNFNCTTNRPLLGNKMHSVFLYT